MIILFLTAHIWSDPYKDRVLDKLDRFALLTSFFTLYSGLYFYTDIGNGVRLILTLVIFVFNVVYLLLFCYHFLSTLRKQLQKKFKKVEADMDTQNLGKVVPVMAAAVAGGAVVLKDDMKSVVA